ncbi:MAG: MmcQ/YjbR family DNA-binding protein [Caulobacteraceae bacterium]|nr:MmcQ/YjbR family DNA-binding protein [Caulobacteraceae bacterium]
MPQTPHQRAEAELTAYGLSLPETDAAPGWAFTRCLRVRGRMFAVFGDKAQPLDALTIIVKLPVSYEMVQELPFVRPGSLWYRQHQWAIAHFGPEDDILAELDTLRAWLRQSYVAMAPKRLGRQVEP